MGLTVLEGLVVEPQGTLILSFGEQVIPFLLELVEFLLMCVCVCVCLCMCVCMWYSTYSTYNNVYCDEAQKQILAVQVLFYNETIKFTHTK